MAPLSDVMEDTSILTETAEPVLCESQYELENLKYPPHEADWYAIGPCYYDVVAMCEGRRLRALKQKGWHCTPGCGAFHVYSDINWVPIK